MPPEGVREGNENLVRLTAEAGVQKVIDMGYADPKHIGLYGHSYSGQGSAYIATQSKMFAAIIPAAAATDLVADFNQLWKTSGTNQHQYDIYGQGRFGTNPYENLQLFEVGHSLAEAQRFDRSGLVVGEQLAGSVQHVLDVAHQ